MNPSGSCCDHDRADAEQGRQSGNQVRQRPAASERANDRRRRRARRETDRGAADRRRAASGPCNSSRSELTSIARCRAALRLRRHANARDQLAHEDLNGVAGERPLDEIERALDQRVDRLVVVGAEMTAEQDHRSGQPRLA